MYTPQLRCFPCRANAAVLFENSGCSRPTNYETNANTDLMDVRYLLLLLLQMLLLFLLLLLVLLL